MTVAFQGRLAFCSNFTACPNGVRVYGILYPTAEHAYQALKTADTRLRYQVRDMPTPGQAKKMGRTLPLRSNWEKIKIDKMRHVVAAKFNQNRTMMKQLIETGTEQLAEVNEWGDRFWGECPAGNGLNWLGRILMDLRESVK